MSFTDNCDIFASFHEEGFNKILGYIQSQRPSLFNYATQGVANNIEAICKKIDAHPIVLSRGNPLVTIQDPLAIPGTPYGLNFAIQLTDLQVDFHPNNIFELPPELNPPIDEQRLAIKLQVCGGLGCPEDIDRYIPPPEDPNKPQDTKTHDPREPPKFEPPIPIPTKELICFCLDVFAIGGVRIKEYYGKPYLEPFIDDIEIVDLKPEGLENSIECYIKLLLKLNVLPGLRMLLQHAPLNLTQGATDLVDQLDFDPTNIVLSPAGVPNNPSISEDQLSVFINAEVVA